MQEMQETLSEKPKYPKSRVINAKKKIVQTYTDFFGEGSGNPLKYSCLENPMDRGAWQATVHGVAKSQARLTDSTYTDF